MRDDEMGLKGMEESESEQTMPRGLVVDGVDGNGLQLSWRRRGGKTRGKGGHCAAAACQVGQAGFSAIVALHLSFQAIWVLTTAPNRQSTGGIPTVPFRGRCPPSSSSPKLPRHASKQNAIHFWRGPLAEGMNFCGSICGEMGRRDGEET